MTTLEDRRGRMLRDLRISVTDRCNFRCVYCMPMDIFGRDFAFMEHDQLLSFEEITRLAKIFVGLGVEKIRITGGEPLIRREIETLVAKLAEIDGLNDLTMTTNASLLPFKAQALKDAGLQRVTISLDALDNDVFRAMSSVNFSVDRILEGIDAAAAAGLTPVKVNMVVKRTMNEDQILPMAEQFRHSGHILRFIEFMDVGSTNGWKLTDVVKSKEIIDRIHAVWPLEPLEPNYEGEVARRYRYADGGGEIGVIASVSQPFCGTCTRARLTSDGDLFTCLFAAEGRNLRDLMRDGASDAELIDRITAVWSRREDRYSELRTEETASMRKIEMSRIGG